MASYRSRILTVAHRDPEFDLGIARVEAGRLDDIVCERIERQLNNTVASFSMAVDAWTDTEDGLKRLLEDAIRQIEEYHHVSQEHGRVEAWLSDLEASVRQGPGDSDLVRFFHEITRQIGSLLVVRNIQERVAELRDQAIRTRCLALLVRDIPADLVSRATRLVNYLCTAEAMNEATVGETNGIPPLIDRLSSDSESEDL